MVYVYNTCILYTGHTVLSDSMWHCSHSPVRALYILRLSTINVSYLLQASQCSDTGEFMEECVERGWCVGGGG